ncbi:MAG: sensor histidine kinase [Gallionella sp.]|nr:sensor histidine kinase [Gallionella sp.]
MIKCIQCNSIETRIIVTLLFLSIMPTAVIGWAAHNMVLENVRTERVKTVGRVADAKHAQLVMVLTRARERAKLFLSNLAFQCDTGNLNQACTAGLIESYLASEKALGATLRKAGGVSLTVGASAATAGERQVFKPGQLAKFYGTGAENNLAYYISVAEPIAGLQLEISYPSSNLQTVFDHPAELGESGETFLADGDGYFVTKARYPSTQGHEMPIHARPMRVCLGGKNTELLDLDYRDAHIIHGFRLVPEFGSACIMAHIDQAEAFAPLRAQEKKLFIVLTFFILFVFLFALYMAKKIARPVKELTTVARAIANGDYASRVNEEGSDEISQLAISFNIMTSQLFAANAQLQQKVINLAESYRELQQLACHLDKVRDEEREWIAREIHDEMGSTLTALKMQVYCLKSAQPTAQFTAEAEYMDKLVGDAIHTMHHVVSHLRPSQLHDLGFRAAVERYVENFQKHLAIECELVLPDEGITPDENQSFVLFRILQESLNNVAKHAQATKVTISLAERPHALILVVKDNGIGFDRHAHRDKNSFGLTGIKERALAVNGRVRVGSIPGKGTQVVIRIPLDGPSA